MLVKSPKLAIIVPYRDREEHLARFVPHMDDFLSKIEHKIFVIEQGDDKPFNRGWLLNIGFDIAKKQGYDYFCFHDVDMLPEDKSCDYSWVDKPTHLASRLSKFNYRLVYPEYIGGVSLINKEHFEWINGFSNSYWGWGFEDDDFLYRCRQGGVPLETQWVGEGKNKESRLISCIELTNGDYLEIPLSESISKVLDSSFTIEAWIEPSDDLELDDNKDYDEFHVFTRPGHHVGIAYTSGMQYKGAVWDENNHQHMVVSDRKGNEWCHVLFTVDNVLKRLRMYINGQETNNSPTDFLTNLRTSNSVPYYIGCANPNARTGDKGWFKGNVAQIVMWDKALEPKEAGVCYNNGYPYNVTKQKEYSGWKIGQEVYLSGHNVVGYWDFDNVRNDKVLDKSGNDNHAKIKGGVITEKELRIGSNVMIPNRRDGKYTCLEHEENGWANTKYTHWESRQNQLRFFNKVRRGLTDYKEDGLSNLKYKINNKETFLSKHEFVSIS